MRIKPFPEQLTRSMAGMKAAIQIIAFDLSFGSSPGDAEQTSFWNTSY